MPPHREPLVATALDEQEGFWANLLDPPAAREKARWISCSKLAAVNIAELEAKAGKSVTANRASTAAPLARNAGPGRKASGRGR